YHSTKRAASKCCLRIQLLLSLIVNRERKIEGINPSAEKLFRFEKSGLNVTLPETPVPGHFRIKHIQQHADYFTNCCD
ncbi:MAG TPA: hypothetical protein VHA52_01830, partial [Candidatus Babeliaceae bacterium]|nr:hypothetical protein [Candidatus Babeliaceae bacterium]